MVGSVVAGIISGLISSGIIYIILFRIKPNVIVSKDICRDREDKLYRVKVVNRTRANLVDVKYTLHYCHRYPDGIVNIEEIPPKKSPVEFLQAYLKSDKDSDYAIRLAFQYDENTSVGPDDYLLFTFYAKHSVSGTTTFLRQEYHDCDFRCGRFETGISTKVLVEVCYNMCKTFGKDCINK